MRFAACVWLLLLAVWLSPRETDSRKLDNDQADSGDATGETVTDTEAVEEEKEEKGDDDGGFGFTFSPFQFLFGYDSDEDDAEKNRPGEEGAGESVNSNDGPSELTETENEVEAESPSSKDGEEERVGTAEVNPEEGKEDEKDDAPAEDVDADNTDTKSKVPDENQGRDDAQEKEEEEEEEDKNGGRLKSEAEEENRNTLGEAPRTETSDEYAGEPRSFLETVPAASVSGEAEPSTVTWEDGATDEETDTRDRLPENSEEMKKETGINDTDLVIFKSLLPVGTPKKNRDSLFTNALPDTYPRTSGKRGYSRDRTVGDNSSMLSDRGYYQPMPMMDDLNRYMRNCDNCLVQWDSYQCPMSDMALELKKWMTELQDLLSYGCQAGEDCARDSKCCHRRDPAMERAMGEMTELARQMYDTFQDSCSNCPRDGGWSDWCEWSACSVTCGNGVRTRSRQCNNPSPKGMGRQCDGLPDDTIPCTGPNCCTDGNWAPWSPWGPCSATCGTGMQDRSRTCSNPPPNSCGRTCPGSPSDMRPCDTGIDCCTDGNWSPWSPWSPCPVTCGSGTVERYRSCSQPPPNYCGQPCPGPERDSRSCYGGRECCVPMNGNWSPWTPWSRCSATCGPGTRDRSRSCSSPPPNECGRTCPGPARDTDRCDGGECCVDGNWGSWERWGQCSVSCGVGLRDRRRRCDSPPANYCGQRCPGRELETESCDTRVPCEPICVDGNWGFWQPWSSCSATCGTGIQSRMRRCDSPSPNFCGQRCPGSASDTQPCQSRRDCCVPQDGNWSPWAPWSRCSATCGPGTRDRSRSCSSPPPNECGRTCPGLARDTDRCDGGECCVDGNWGQWQPWTRCSATCDRGSRSRRRRCDNPPANYCGNRCPGRDMEQDTCLEGPCPIICVPRDGNWGSWTPWSSCSSTCGPGTRDRSRVCSNPPPNSCGSPCPGRPRETDRCDSGPCCVDGNWGPWQPWSRVSVTCGVGQRDRRRRCDSPAANYCGRTCPGRDIETDSYDTRVPCRPVCVPRDGNWSPWTPWTRCSATCGPGTRDRSRSCSSPPPNECGRTCPGPSRDTDRCDGGPCCVDGNWGPWQPWSRVSVTCGVGQRDRRRRCDSPAANYCGRTCPGRDVETDTYDTRVPCQPICVDGNWGPWQPWSSCSASCGTGLQTRMRRCDNPTPNFCGQRCPGSSSDTQRCDTGRDCCVPRNGNWSPWAPWSRCSATCGPGTRDRSRSCSSPPPNECGRTCPGPARDTDRCDGGPCCVDGNWGPWQPWSQPSVSCGMSQRDRRRRCDSPAANYCGRTCPGRDVETDMYDTRVPCEPICVPRNGNWSPWTRWESCSVTCGPGSRRRTRSCTNPPPNECGSTCPGSSLDTGRCNEGDCCIPMDGNWSPWTRWSRCSATCGPGTRDRSRSCSNPSPNECGRTCPGRERDTERCDGGECCVDGNWAQWGSWGPCSATCGAGTQLRERTCSDPPPNYCGSKCMGPSRDTRRCTEQKCCVDGNWGPWQPWSRVSVTCGVGQRDRRRRCDSPAANYCGRTCPGRDVETESYDTRVPCRICVDGNWGPWQPWSRVSVTCGVGQRDRRRRCDSPAANECGQPCPGRDFETDSYDTRVPCRVCVDGNWGPWQPWSQPSVTCGVGQRDRRRRCDSPAANECGRPCPGRDFETDSYDTRVPCRVCVDGNWGPWEPFGACSVTCGRGQQLRRRRCDNPPANICGVPCPGPASDARPCDQGPCCADRQWSSWSRWSNCDVTCGSGTRTRDRTCQSVGYGPDCGNICPGPRTEVDDCPGLPNCPPDCGSWSQCSATCAGFGTRQRFCNYPGFPGSIGGSRTETERCQVFSPPCAPPADWGEWAAWCPCGCDDGRRSRRRTCVRRSRFGLEETVDIAACGAGDAREEEYCDIRGACPLCVSDCAGRVDGEYPSCTSCSDYVRCTNGRLSIFSCTTQGYVWDAFIKKCVRPPSPSCSLVPCVSSCMGQEDGLYHSCFGCSQYVECRNGRDTERNCPPDQEFNAHSGRCSPGVSPTCVRAITRSVDFMVQDAPADDYFVADDMDEKQRQELYLELRKKAGVAAKFNRTDEDIFNKDDDDIEVEKTKKSDDAVVTVDDTGNTTDNAVDNGGEEEEEMDETTVVIESEETASDKEKKKKKTEKTKTDDDGTSAVITKKGYPCHNDCSEVGPGMFQSCKGCRFYLICTKHGVAREMKCPRHKYWDDKRKKCKKQSRTCKDRRG